ncbi:phasin family protein [Oceanicella sp. SM1341]|uniref:phasin family protein n=1 Tax=Oceanicella sp. SM1341 TaxID=1548889 RepID=UPI001300851D|nr:phasin family protein [Oceanicella sp. SM1341]
MPTTKPTPADAYSMEQHFSVAPFIEAQQRALKATLDIQSQAMARAARFGTEYADFLRQRLEEDRKAAVEAASCRTPQEMLTLSTAFMETAVKQYGEEFSSLAQICLETLQDTARAVPEITPLPAAPVAAPARASEAA